MAAKKPLELVDVIADVMQVEIIDRDEFTARVNNALVSWIVPRLYVQDLVNRNIITPKKASNDARAAREVTGEQSR
jgi:hypothetical protein